MYGGVAGGVADLASKVPSVEGHASERLAWFLPSLALYEVRLEVFTIAPDAEVYAHRRQRVWGGGSDSCHEMETMLKRIRLHIY